MVRRLAFHFGAIAFRSLAIASPFALAACNGASTVGSPPSAPTTSTPSGTSPTPFATPTAGSTAPGSTALSGLPTFVDPLRHNGAYFTDGLGRVVTFHGINVANKLPPYTAQAEGFTQQDAAFLAQEGFTQVRFALLWTGVEPSPGVFDDTQLAAAQQAMGWLESYGVTSQLDFQQEGYAYVFGGIGEPDWSADSNGLPNIGAPSTGATGNTNIIIDGLANPAMHRAEDNFWQNAAFPGSVGLTDAYTAMWKHVASYFLTTPGITGYDVFNEPAPGSLAPGVFDLTELNPWWEKIVPAIRTVDSVHQIDYEPYVLQFETPQADLVEAGKDPNLCLAWHYYPSTDEELTTLGEVAIQAFQSHASANGDVQEMNEFGSTDDLTQISDIVTAADAERESWDYWAFFGQEPTGNAASPGVSSVSSEGVVIDPLLPPTGANLKTAKLAVLDRPYPYLVSGVPTAWNYNTTSNTFTLTYSTTPAGGGPQLSAPTVVVVPQRNYPNGYKVAVTGATVTSAANAEALTLKANASASNVSLSLTNP